MPSTYQPITERLVERLKHGDANAAPNTFIRDPSIIGFAILVNASSAAYVIEGRAGRGGRNVRQTIGRLGRVELDEARRQAKEKLALLGRGVDLVEQHEEHVIRKKTAAVTVGEALTLATAPARHLKGGTVADYQRSVETLGWEKRLLSSIKPEHLKKRFGELGGRAQASRVMRTLSSLWNVARDKYPSLPENPVPSLQQVTKGWRRTRRARRIIPDALLAEWRLAVDGLEREDVRDLILFCFYTGCRIGEPKALTLDDLNLRAESFTFCDPKNRHDCALPITRQLAPLLARRAAAAKKGEPLFPQGDVRKSYAPTVAVSAWSWNDLRRGFISAAERLGVPEQIKRTLTNHAIPGEDAHAGYIVLPPDALRPDAQRISDFLDQLATPKGGKVVPLKRRA